MEKVVHIQLTLGQFSMLMCCVQNQLDTYPCDAAEELLGTLCAQTGYVPDHEEDE